MVHLKAVPKVFIKSFRFMVLKSIWVMINRFCVQILLKTKKRESYNQAFEELIKLIGKDKEDFQLKKINTDFETALQTSLFKIIKQKYEIDIEFKGCWFHFNQAGLFTSMLRHYFK